jgi:hypothetical protein
LRGDPALENAISDAIVEAVGYQRLSVRHGLAHKVIDTVLAALDAPSRPPPANGPNAAVGWRVAHDALCPHLKGRFAGCQIHVNPYRVAATDDETPRDTTTQTHVTTGATDEDWQEAARYYKDDPTLTADAGARDSAEIDRGEDAS